jgi:hypothetical protein
MFIGLKLKSKSGANTHSIGMIAAAFLNEQVVQPIKPTPAALLANPVNVIVGGDIVGFEFANIVADYNYIEVSDDNLPTVNPTVIDVYARYKETDTWLLVLAGVIPQLLDSIPNTSPLGYRIDLTPISVYANAIPGLNNEQIVIIGGLSIDQQIAYANGSSSQKKAITSLLPINQQAVFTSVPVEFIQTPEQIASDRLRLDEIVFKLKSGQFLIDNDSVFYALGNSLMATAAMTIIDNGGGFNELRNAKLTQAQALAVLSIYNVELDVSKYESEQKLNVINSDPSKLPLLQAYLATLTPPLTLPPLTSYLAAVRADHAVYTAIKNWNGS